MPYGQRHWTVTLRVADRDCGRWAAKSGGGKTTDESTYDDHDGKVQLGGVSGREPIELRKLYKREVHAIYAWLDGQCDVDAACKVIQTPTGDDGVSWGSPIVMTGVLAGVAPPDVEKGSADGGELTITINADARLA